MSARLSGIMGASGWRGIAGPLLTLLLAFFAGGLVIAAAGSNPLTVYRAIFEGSGLNIIFWGLLDGEEQTRATANMQQTLVYTTPLILVGLAVAIAFRAGMFNIGGQGQYTVGTIAAVYVGTRLDGLPAFLHILLAMLAAMAAGALWAGIAGFLRARTGANEVISTIMLNWIAIWVGVYLFSLGGPLQDPESPSVPQSAAIAESAYLPTIWGSRILQGVHLGLPIALAGAFFAYVLVSRSVAGYRIRAVGLNPDAAEYAGINSGRQQIIVMAICGMLAGLAGALDILGWQSRLNTNDIQVSTIGFVGIAVALLGRNTALGTVLAALLFGALVTGTGTRNLDGSVFSPELASNLTLIIQGLIVLLVSAPVLATKLLGRPGSGEPPDAAPAAEGDPPPGGAPAVPPPGAGASPATDAPAGSPPATPANAEGGAR